MQFRIAGFSIVRKASIANETAPESAKSAEFDTPLEVVGYVN